MTVQLEAEYQSISETERVSGVPKVNRSSGSVSPLPQADAIASLQSNSIAETVEREETTQPAVEYEGLSSYVRPQETEKIYAPLRNSVPGVSNT